MRKITNILQGFILVLLATSCLDRGLKTSDSGQSEDRVIKIVAHHADDDTKTTLAVGGSVLWMPQDSISVFYGNPYVNHSYGKCVADITSPSSVASFYGLVPDKTSFTEEDQQGSGAYYYAFYPYKTDVRYSGVSIYYTFPSLQFAKKDSFGETFFPSAARSRDFEMYFYNVCGGIKITVAKEGVRKIKLRSNAGERISGDGSVSFDENGRPYCDLWNGNGTFIDFVAPDGGFEVGEPYYIVIPPVTFSQGFTLTFMTDDETAVKVVDRTVEIKRSVFSKMTEADKDADYEKEPSLVDMLAGENGKYWLWDIQTETDGSSWGSGVHRGSAYEADNNVVPNKSWGNSPDELTEEDSAFQYMFIDRDLNCISYSEDGKELRRGKITVDGFSRINRADGWSLGTFMTDAPAILHPRIYGPELTDFDILRLTEGDMILSRTAEEVNSDGDIYYYWWRFRSIDRQTFEKGFPTGISLDKTSIEVYQGDSFELKATITPEDRSFWGVQWSRGDNQIWRQSPGHYYVSTGNEVENTKVVVKTAGGLMAECEVTVRDRIPVQEITLEPNHLELIQEESAQLTAIVLPENATLQDVVWESENPEIATVDQTGLVTAVSQGWTNLRAITDGGRTWAWCGVYVRSNSVEGIRFEEYYYEMYPGDKQTLVATIYPETAKNKNILWYSYDENIAKVDDKGEVTAVSPGWVRVRATSEENAYEAYCNINVKPVNVTGVMLDKESVEMFVGDRVALTATVLPENATDKSLSWTVDKKNVVTVDRNGYVKAIGSGNVTVTVKTVEGGFTASCTISVRSNGVDPGIGDWGDGEKHDGSAE